MTQALIDQERADKYRQTSAPPRYEYIEARSMEQVHGLAAQGWRVHTALLVPASAAKLYLMERERP